MKESEINEGGKITVSSIYLLLRFIRCLTILKLRNSTQLRLASFFHSATIKGMPETLTVEPSAVCNLNCPECTIGSGNLLRPQGYMNQDTFIQSFEPLKKFLVHLQLYFQGEPMLNPSLFEMIRQAHASRVFTSFSTNGHYLSEGNCIKIIESGLDRIIISVDGTTQEVYGKYRQGGSLAKVIEGIKALAAAKKKVRSSHPHVVVQFVVFRHNEHQISEIKNVAKSWGANQVTIKTAQIEHLEQAEKLVPVNPKYSRYQRLADGTYRINKKAPINCFRLRSVAVVNQAGEVYPCCYDKNGEFAMGNVRHSDAKLLWNSSRFNEFRLHVWKNKQMLDICANCPEGMKR